MEEEEDESEPLDRFFRSTGGLGVCAPH